MSGVGLLVEQLADNDLRYLFRKTESWLYSYQKWRAWLDASYGQEAHQLSSMPPLKRTSKPTGAISVSRAELSRRVDMMAVVFNLLSPSERRLVELFYWTQAEDAIKDTFDEMNMTALERALRDYEELAINLFATVGSEIGWSV